MASLPRAYGGVCFMVSLISGNYLITRDTEKIQRQAYFEDDGGMHKLQFENEHIKQVGD